MTEKILHIIDKFEYKINGNSVAGSNQLQQQISTMHKEKLQEVMSRCFDSFFPAGSHLRLQKLEINIGKIPENNFERQFLTAFEEQLVRKLQSLVKQQKITENSVTDNTEKGREKVAGLKAAAQSDWDLLIFFFKTGRLGWWAPLQQKPDMEAVLLKFLDGPENRSQKQMRQQLSELLKEKYVLQRMVQQLSLPLLQRLLAFAIEALNLRIPALPGTTAFHTRKILITSIEKITQANFPFTADIFYIAFLTEALKSRSDFNKKEITKEAVKYLPEALTKKLTELSDEQLTDSSLKKILQQLKYKKTGKQPQKPTKENQQNQQNQKETAAEPQGSLAVHNAGVILLWPYFSRFFTSTGLLEKKQFTDEGKKVAAVYYLHYLATGNTRAYEYELLLNKILCGLPLNFPLQREFEIPEEVKTETQNLLLSFIRYWPALKSTSLQGLQQAFLTRHGKLYIKEKSCTIRIERGGIDVLLDKLPHGISLITLPWLNKIIHTEW